MEKSSAELKQVKPLWRTHLLSLGRATVENSSAELKQVKPQCRTPIC